MSEEIITTSNRVLKVSDTLKNFEKLSALTINYLTAYLTIVKQARFTHGDSIFIQGAAGKPHFIKSYLIN